MPCSSEITSQNCVERCRKSKAIVAHAKQDCVIYVVLWCSSYLSADLISALASLHVDYLTHFQLIVFCSSTHELPNAHCNTFCGDEQLWTNWFTTYEWIVSTCSLSVACSQSDGDTIDVSHSCKIFTTITKHKQTNNCCYFSCPSN